MKVDEAAADFTGSLPPRLREPAVDFDMLRNYRLSRLRKLMAEKDIALAVISNPLSMRYAIDYWNYPLFLSRIPSTFVFLPVEGPIAMSGAYDDGNPLIEEIVPMFGMAPFDGGLDQSDESRRFADYVKDRLKNLGFDARARVAVDRVDPSAMQALMQAGIEVCDVAGVMEYAKAIKSPEEIILMRHAISVAKYGIDRMREHMIPGTTERELWSFIHQANIANGGFWTEGNMLASGDRSNPWLQEASDRPIADGELVAFDTDMVGPYSYFCDVSRTLLVGDGKPTDRQRDLYRHAYDEVYSNMERARAGVSFREFSEKAFPRREEFKAQRYPCVAHGVGMCDEWPKILYQEDWTERAYDGVFEPGMVMCIESYTGAVGDKEGVKLEEMVHITEDGFEILSDLVPLEMNLLN